jgi:hypothetical protein
MEKSNPEPDDVYLIAATLDRYQFVRHDG